MKGDKKKQETKELKRRGPKTKLTTEKRVKLLHAAAIDASIEEMAFYCDVTRQTVHNWIKKDKKLFDEIERLRSNPVFTARQSVVDNLSDPEYALKYLERKKKDEFSTRSELTGKDGEKVEVQVIGMQVI